MNFWLFIQTETVHFQLFERQFIFSWITFHFHTRLATESTNFSSIDNSIPVLDEVQVYFFYSSFKFSMKFKFGEKDLNGRIWIVFCFNQCLIYDHYHAWSGNLKWSIDGKRKCLGSRIYPWYDQVSNPSTSETAPNYVW